MKVQAKALKRPKGALKGPRPFVARALQRPGEPLKGLGLGALDRPQAQACQRSHRGLNGLGPNPEL